MEISKFDKTHLWMSEYISLSSHKYSSKNEHLWLKSAGEFSLLCYLIKRITKLPDVFIESLSLIDSLVPRNFHFSPFIKISLGIPIDKGCISAKNKGIEYSYLRYLFASCQPNWAHSLCLHLDCMSKEGLSRDNAYLLTHLIFYSTDFGRLDYWKNYPDLKVVCKELLCLCEDKYREEQNWDLLREIYLCKLFLTPETASDISQKVINEDSCIASNQGWFLSDGLRLSHYEDNHLYLNSEEKYSLFHTTLISLLLEYSIQNC